MSQPTAPAKAGNAPNSPAPNDHHVEDEMDVDGDMGVDLSPQKRSKRKLNDAGSEEVDQNPSNASNQTSSDTMQVDHHPNDDSAVNHVAKKAKLHENPPNAAAELLRIHLPTGHSRYQIYIATEAGSVFFGNQDASAVQIRYCVPFVSTADSFTVGNLKQLVSHKYAIPEEQQRYLSLSASFPELITNHTSMSMLDVLPDTLEIAPDFVRNGGIIFMRRATLSTEWKAPSSAPVAVETPSRASRRHGSAR